MLVPVLGDVGDVGPDLGGAVALGRGGRCGDASDREGRREGGRTGLEDGEGLGEVGGVGGGVHCTRRSGEAEGGGTAGSGAASSGGGVAYENASSGVVRHD